jgi:thioredoxin-like negative regulator of GroEL
MTERLALAVAIILGGVAAYLLLRYGHMRRASRVAPAGSRPRVLYFWTASCAPCVVQGHYLQRLADDFGGRVAVEKIDAEADAGRAAQFGVFTVPTTLVVDQTGRVCHINYGLTDDRKLARQLAPLAASAN